MRLETVRAKAGALLLDLLQPGWADRIDTESLDLASCQVCVLGQLFGEYEYGAAKVFAMRFEGLDNVRSEREKAAGDAGFCVAREVSYDDSGPAYRRLTAAWKREIDKRVV